MLVMTDHRAIRADTQVHVVSPDHARYPLDPPPMDVPRWFEKYPRSAEQLLAEMDGAGVDRVVLVQGFSAYQYDNRYTADSSAAYPDRFACACIVDVQDEAVAAVRHWVRDRGARAIRFFLQLGDGAWLDDEAATEAWNELAALGAIAQAAVVAEQLPRLARRAVRHPDVPVLVDHCAFPDFSGGPGYPNAGALFALADLPNVNVKLSNHVFDAAEEGGSTARAATERIVAAFGAERVMWASDLTVQERPYRELVARAEEACAGLSTRERELFLGESALGLWWPSR
jgi:L-fuconolactonase